ncbi:hypothetical protein GGI02_002339 [Coemansia sp. RSA 2322]|nr:hypothetical protein GGI02_002339 [Coemansia sp. RSA 2322]
MSYLQVIPADGKTDEQRYDEFVEYLFKDGVVEQALDTDYDGEYKGLIQEKIAADLSPVGGVFDSDHKDITVARHRAMLIRAGVDPEARSLCKSLDGQIKFDLSEEDLKAIAELELKDDEIEDEIFVRPFALYAVDTKHLYGRELEALPESAVEFAKMALEHEMDCAYEDSEDDGDWENEDDDEDDEEDDHEGHIHGDGCCSGDANVFNMDDDLPFSEDKVSVNDAETGLALLKDRKAEVVAMLEKITGSKVDSFKSYHFPGRHYIVTWLKDFGVFGVRVSYPMLVNDSDDEDEDGDEEEEEEDSDDDL